MVRYLVENGADVRANDDYAIKQASKNGHLEVVRYLVENGADVRAENDCAVKWAFEYGHSKIVSYLVEKGAPKQYVEKLNF